MSLNHEAILARSSGNVSTLARIAAVEMRRMSSVTVDSKTTPADPFCVIELEWVSICWAMRRE